jgi:hypothetical protein
MFDFFYHQKSDWHRTFPCDRQWILLITFSAKYIDFAQIEIEIVNLRADLALESSWDHLDVVKYYGSSIACSMRYFFMEYMISFDLRSI